MNSAGKWCVILFLATTVAAHNQRGAKSQEDQIRDHNRG